MAATAPLPASAHLGRVALQVGNLERSLRFYRDVIGFDLIGHGTEQAHALARLGHRDGSACLLELHERPGARPVPPRGLLGLYHFAILLPQRADLGRFAQHAANAATRFAAADHLFSEALYLTDPDGLQVEVYADRPRKLWQYSNGEVVGDTLPLDLDSVVAAAAGTTWQGLPAGTVIGHVHLYVGDLAPARSFYVQGLGFEPSVSSFPGALFVAAGGYHHHVGLNTWAARAPVAAQDDARLQYWELVLPDAAARDDAAARLRAAGHVVTWHRDSATAIDPWQIAVRLITADR